MTTFKILTFLNLLFLSSSASANNARWKIASNRCIMWNIAHNIPHNDNIEMSGKRVSTVLRYGVDGDGAFTLTKSMVWPMLRTIPNNTHASLMKRFEWNPLDEVIVEGGSLSKDKVEQIRLDGTLVVESKIKTGNGKQLKLIREYFPSTEEPVLIENYRIINLDNTSVAIEIPVSKNIKTTDPNKGKDGAYRIELNIDDAGKFILQPGDTLSFGAHIGGYKMNQSPNRIDIALEKEKRLNLVSS